eukprot:3121207-Rhodomonas_salina.1
MLRYQYGYLLHNIRTSMWISTDEAYWYRCAVLRSGRVVPGMHHAAAFHRASAKLSLVHPEIQH